MSQFPKFRPLDLPELPIAQINRALGTELEPGPAFMSGVAHKHAAEKHPEDYAVCVANLALTISAPSFIGQAPHHSDNFILIRRVPGPAGKSVLAAVGIAPDEDGRYRVKSMYRIDQADLDRWRLKGTVKPAPK